MFYLSDKAATPFQQVTLHMNQMLRQVQHMVRLVSRY
jgi:hypothetical protein